MITAFALINSFIPALVPTERWQAARQLKHGFMTERWFITLMVISAIGIVTMIFSFRYFKKAKQQKSTPPIGSFTDYDAKRDLSEQERQNPEA